jgi:GNAT superfamily N-acetyltransferase
MAAESGPFKWLVEPLSKKHEHSAFSCGNESLDRYLKEIAGQDASRKVAAPFVLIAETDPKAVVGYYTLSALGVDLSDFPIEVIKKLNLPPYRDIPVTLLGRLAVDTIRKGQGLGEFLLLDALSRALAQSSQIAAAAVVVDAIDEPAVRFYEHFEFRRFPETQDRLFLPMKTIAQLL